MRRALVAAERVLAPRLLSLDELAHDLAARRGGSAGTSPQPLCSTGRRHPPAGPVTGRGALGDAIDLQVAEEPCRAGARFRLACERGRTEARLRDRHAVALGHGGVPVGGTVTATCWLPLGLLGVWREQGLAGALAAARRLAVERRRARGAAPGALGPEASPCPASAADASAPLSTGRLPARSGCPAAAAWPARRRPGHRRSGPAEHLRALARDAGQPPGEHERACKQ